MSTNTASRLGLFPQILPITGSFLLPFGAISALLSLNVVRARLSTGTFLGDKQSSTGADPSYDPNNDQLYLSTRVHSNYSESVPIVLLLAAACELNGADKRYLTGALATFLALRIAHAIGLGAQVLDARRLGYFGTQGFTLGMAGWSMYLSKSYWGL